MTRKPHSAAEKPPAAPPALAPIRSAPPRQGAIIPEPRPAGWRLPLLVFAVALFIRVALVFYARAIDPFFGWSTKGFDQHVFQTWAEKILKGDLLLREAGLFYYSPIFAYFSALIYWIFGLKNFLAVHLCQALLGAGASGLVYLTARTWMRQPFAIFATASYSLAGPVLFYEQTLLIEGLVLCGIVVWLWALRTGMLGLQPEYASIYRRPHLRLGLAGLAVAFVAIGRGNALALLLASLAWCAWATRGAGPGWLPSLRAARWPAVLAILAGALLMLLPMVIRNYVVSDRLTLGMTNGKVMFYLGNAADARGDFSYSERFMEAQKRANAGEADAYRTMFLQDLRTAPQNIVATLLRKTWFFLGTNDLPDNVNFQLAQRYLLPVGASPVRWEWLAPLGLVGLLLAGLDRELRQRGPGLLWLFAIVFAISIIIIIPVGRYRLPIVLGWSLGAGMALEWLVTRWRAGGREKPLLVCAAVLGCMMLLWPWGGPLIRDNDFANALSAALTSERRATGERIVDTAIRHSRAHTPPPAPPLASHWLSYKLDFARRAKDRAALAEVARQLSQMPLYTRQSALNLAMAWLELGQREQARPIVAQLYQSAPDDPQIASLAAALEVKNATGVNPAK